MPVDSRGSVLSRLTRSGAFAWFLSLAFHAAAFGGLYAVVFRQEPIARRDVIPEARLAPAEDELTQAQPPPVDADQPPNPALNAPLPKSFADLPTVTAQAESGITTPRFRPPDAAQTAFAPPRQMMTAPVAGPVARFFGQVGTARKVVYVVDVSASLMIYTDDIADELTGSVRDLVPIQRFHVVLAMPQDVREFDPRRLVPATARYKRRLENFANVIRGVPEPGKADPLEAMRRAFAVDPELIYFLTDGDYPDIEQDLLALLEQLNAQRAVKITTIGFDPSPRPRQLLERIAREHGGNCRVVTPR
jgi:hypothetical protein